MLLSLLAVLVNISSWEQQLKHKNPDLAFKDHTPIRRTSASQRNDSSDAVCFIGLTTPTLYRLLRRCSFAEPCKPLLRLQN